MKHCPQLRDQLKNIKTQFDAYILELEQAKSSKEYEPALSMQPKLTQAILELDVIINPSKYFEAYVTEIERKNKASIPLTKAEIIFLYDARDKVSDPRIAEILRNRNPKEDAPIVFDCQLQEIAHDVKEINENTKAYIGPWSADIFQTIRNYPNITHFYESFPDEKIFMITLETDARINSPQKAEQALKEKNILCSNDVKYLLTKTEYSQKSETYHLVRFTLRELGLKGGMGTDTLFKRIEELGLEACPAEVGPQLRLQYSGKENFGIAMKPIFYRKGYLDHYDYIFVISSDGRDVLKLESDCSETIVGWRASTEFVFCFRKEDKK